jgi:hypothetical protein
LSTSHNLGSFALSRVYVAEDFVALSRGDQRAEGCIGIGGLLVSLLPGPLPTCPIAQASAFFLSAATNSSYTPSWTYTYV